MPKVENEVSTGYGQNLVFYFCKQKCAAVVKQWSSTLDGDTRPTHKLLDGQIRETKEPFEAGGKKAMYPGAFGDPAEDCNCRCIALTRARWALDEDELQTLKDRAEYFGLDKTKDFDDFMSKHLKIYRSSGKAGDTDGNTVINSVIPFNFDDKKAIQNEIDKFASKYSNANEEHAIVISPIGEMYVLTGTYGTVNTEMIGEDALIGSIGTHNHPVFDGFESGDSFSLQDVIFSVEKKTGTEYLTTGNKRYSFVYNGTLSSSEIYDEYKKAMLELQTESLYSGKLLNFIQEDTMKRLSDKLEGFEFNVL